jgi:hypothetical protein
MLILMGIGGYRLWVFWKFSDPSSEALATTTKLASDIPHTIFGLDDCLRCNCFKTFSQ